MTENNGYLIIQRNPVPHAFAARFVERGLP